MCFTPLASLTTATIEFCIAIYLFYRVKDKRLYPIAILVLLLGLYQLTEFMLCRSTQTIIWARFGFAIYTFMPILLYHFFINAANCKIKRWLYIFPVFFASIALFYPGFINYTGCNYLHVTVESLIFNQNLTFMFVYLIYYIYCPVYGVYIFSKKLKLRKSTIGLKLGVGSASFALLAGLLYYWWSSVYETNIPATWLHTSLLIVTSALILLLMSILFIRRLKCWFYEANAIILATTTVTIFILYYILPNITHNYSSIFCQFAVFYGIAAVLLINSLDGKVLK